MRAKERESERAGGEGGRVSSSHQHVKQKN